MEDESSLRKRNSLVILRKKSAGDPKSNKSKIETTLPKMEEDEKILKLKESLFEVKENQKNSKITIKSKNMKKKKPSFSQH